MFFTDVICALYYSGDLRTLKKKYSPSPETHTSLVRHSTTKQISVNVLVNHRAFFVYPLSRYVMRTGFGFGFMLRSTTARDMEILNPD